MDAYESTQQMRANYKPVVLCERKGVLLGTGEETVYLSDVFR